MGISTVITTETTTTETPTTTKTPTTTATTTVDTIHQTARQSTCIFEQTSVGDKGEDKNKAATQSAGKRRSPSADE